MRKIFFTGLATFLPIAITLFIILFIVNFLTAPFIGIMENVLMSFEEGGRQMHPFALLIISRVCVLFLLTFLIFFLGFLGRRLFFSYFLKLMNRLFEKIPIVKTIYRITQEVTKSFISPEKKDLFKGTVSVPFPHQKTRAMGLLAGDAPEAMHNALLPEHAKQGLKSIFVPTAPHPISGFLLMYRSEEIQMIDMSTEDLFTFLLSGGTVYPGEKQGEKKR
ncbi:MAG: DUF502 domain-containing protein [Simkania negevensis]|nr:DUF502 domain-containing protein [Simkania negevensis]